MDHKLENDCYMVIEAIQAQLERQYHNRKRKRKRNDSKEQERIAALRAEQQELFDRLARRQYFVHRREADKRSTYQILKQQTPAY